jgi:hypothetical protein
MSTLSTYSEWSTHLEKFGKGDDQSLEMMCKGSFVIDAGTAYRFYTIVEESYRARKNTWFDKYNRILQLQTLKSENDFSIIIRDVRSGLLPMKKFISINAFPEKLQNALKEDFDQFVTGLRDTMKANINRHSSMKERLVLVLNSFHVSETDSNYKQITQTITPTSPNSTVTGRKIIF